MNLCSRMANVTIVPATQESNRTQMIVKKINANGRIVVVNQTQTQLATINKIQASAAATSAAQRGGPR